MIKTPENFALATKTAFDTCSTAARTGFDSVERLTALNLNTARALFVEGSDNVRALLAVKSPNEFFALQASIARPAAEKALAYYRGCYEILAQGLEEAVKPFELQFAEANKAFASTLEKAARSAPAGSDFAVAAVQSAIAAANSTFDSVSKATRKVVEMTEANVVATADAAVKAVGTTTGAAAEKKTA